VLSQIVEEWDAGSCVDIRPDESTLFSTFKTVREL
jgi:hypothetical protein